jgi:hypothetical protein
MGILSFEEPKKVRDTKEHNEMYMSDCNVAGTYVPNMSEEDRLKWKAKHIKGSDERIEIKKGFGGTQVVIVVYKNIVKGNWQERIEGHDNVRISVNSKIHMTFEEYEEFKQAIDEAKALLSK